MYLKAVFLRDNRTFDFLSYLLITIALFLREYALCGRIIINLFDFSQILVEATLRERVGMATRRTTNNSVSTLEEQTEMLQSIMTKESDSKASEAKAKADKAARKRKAKASAAAGSAKRHKSSLKPAALESCMDAQLEPEIDQVQPSWPTWSEARAAAGAGQMVLGNAVPGFQFGQVEEPAWADEDEPESQADMSEMFEEDRPVHDMSDGDNESEMLEGDIEDQNVVQQEEIVVVTPAIPQVKKKGIFADILKDNLQHVKESDKVAVKLSTEVAFGVEKYLTDCVYTSELEKLAKLHPRVENVASMKVPRLDMEVYQVIDQKVRNTDQSLQAIQKGIVGAMSALSPLLQLAYERADADEDFDACGKGLWESIQLLSFSLNGISTKRRELIKPCLAPMYAQVLTKGHETTPDWLYGGNLVETTKKCEVAKKIGEKILNKKSQQPKQQQQPQNRGRGRGRGRGHSRGFNANQGFRVPAQQQQGLQYQVPQQQMFVPMGFQQQQQRMPRPQYNNSQYNSGYVQQFPKNKNNQPQMK